MNFVRYTMWMTPGSMRYFLYLPCAEEMIEYDASSNRIEVVPKESHGDYLNDGTSRHFDLDTASTKKLFTVFPSVTRDPSANGELEKAKAEALLVAQDVVAMLPPPIFRDRNLSKKINRDIHAEEAD